MSSRYSRVAAALLVLFLALSYAMPASAANVQRQRRAPRVTVQAPSTAAGTVAIEVAVTGRQIVAVELYLDGVLIGSSSTAPATYTWDSTTVENGLHRLRARATDAAGRIGRSAVVAVTVANVAPGGGSPEAPPGGGEAEPPADPPTGGGSEPGEGSLPPPAPVEPPSAALPELPRGYVDTSMPWPLVDNPGQGARTPGGGIYRVVGDTGDPDQNGSNLYSAVQAAQTGDEVVLDAGARYRLAMDLPRRPEDAGWIIVRPRVVSALPAENFRFQPSVHASSAPIIAAALCTLGGCATLFFPNGSHHWRFVGIRIETEIGAYHMVQIGDGWESYATLPHHVILDRSWIRGFPASANGPDATANGVSFRGFDLAVVDSSITDISMLNAEAHGVILFNGQRHKIVNNYVEAATENFFSVQQGGFGWMDYPTGEDVLDVEIRRNYFAKPLKWSPADPNYDGVPRHCKNLFELKNGSRVLIEENEFHHSIGTAGPAAQPGYMFALSVRSDNGQAPHGTIRDVWLRWNRFKGGGVGPTLDGIDGGMLPDGGVQGQRWRLEQNLWEDIGRTYWAPDVFAYKYHMLIQPATPVRELTFVHNTFIYGDLAQVPDRMAVWWNSNGNTNEGFTQTGFVYRDNIADSGGVGGWVSGAGGGSGLGAMTFGVNYSTYDVSNNLWFGEPGGHGAIETLFAAPARNSYGEADIAGVGFVNASRRGGDYRLAPTSRYRGRASDGTDLGAHVEELVQRLTGSSSTDARTGGTYTTNPVVLRPAGVNSGE